MLEKYLMYVFLNLWLCGLMRWAQGGPAPGNIGRPSVPPSASVCQRKRRPVTAATEQARTGNGKHAGDGLTREEYHAGDQHQADDQRHDQPQEE